MDIHDPVSILTLTNGLEAEILKNFLQSHGIRCYLNDANTNSVYAGLQFASVQVMVPAEDADRASKLLESHEKERRSYGEEDWRHTS